MNNKGFTTIELVLTIMIVLVIMATITSVTYTYRDRSIYEEKRSEATNYKNNITKIIYDDILNSNHKIVGIRECEESEICYAFIDNNNSEYVLQIISKKDMVGIKYRDIDYWFPISNSEYDYDASGLKIVDDYYSLDIIFTSENLEEPYTLHFVVS